MSSKFKKELLTIFSMKDKFYNRAINYTESIEFISQKIFYLDKLSFMKGNVKKERKKDLEGVYTGMETIMRGNIRIISKKEMGNIIGMMMAILWKEDGEMVKLKENLNYI